MIITTHPGQRPGAFAPLTALLLIPLVGMLAFAVDLGYLVLVQSDLQSAADAAALAGAAPMMDGFVQYNLPGQSATNKATILSNTKANCIAAAKKYAGYNTAGVASLTLNDSDIEFGYTNQSGTYSTTTSNFSNTIKVTLRRDSSANGSVGLFFGPVVGQPTADLSTSAAATIYEATVSGMQNVSSFNLRMLPMTYDVNNWNNFLASGQNPDGSRLTDGNGNPAIQVYPSIKDTGNFGLISLNDSHAGASTISGWIDNGMRQSEVQGLINGGGSADTPLIPLSSHVTTILPSASKDGNGSWNWVGEPGMKESVVHTLSNYVGNTYLIPLFMPLDDGTGNTSTYNGNADSGANGYEAGSGGGSHFNYNIVQFTSVQILSTTGGVVIVQPSSLVVDFSQVTFGSTPIPAGSGATTTTTTFVSPKLTQ